jgi:hypothetical protein
MVEEFNQWNTELKPSKGYAEDGLRFAKTGPRAASFDVYNVHS